MLGSRFRVFTVHINPKQPQAYEHAKFVEEGFNVKAFIFSGAWALYYRLWWPLFAIVVSNLMIFEMADNGTITLIGKVILQFGVNFIIGCEGNDWRRARLARTGHIITDIVTAESLVRAEQRFFDRYFADVTAAPAV